MSQSSLSNIFNLCYGVLMLLFSIIFIIIMILSDSDNKIIGYLFFVALGFFGFLNFLMATSRISYIKNNRNYHFELNKKSQKIIVRNNYTGIETKIDNKDIKEINLFDSWEIPSTWDLSYSEIILNNNKKYYVTKQQMDTYFLWENFKPKIKHQKKRLYNPIKETQN